jgi:hypothetical protein
MPMKRTLFHIPVDQLEQLHAVAAQRKVSTGELVRRFIDQGLARTRAPTDMDEGNMLRLLQEQIAEIRRELADLRSRFGNQP